MIQERHETYMRRRFIEDEIHDLKQIQPHDTDIFIQLLAH